MTNSLLALEQSLHRARKANHKVKSMNVLPPEKLQQQIDVVRGKSVGQPSSGLRSLENRLLARPSCRESLISQLETQRLDHGQAPIASVSVAAPLAMAKTVSTPETMAFHRANSNQSYVPEFSAPDTGRFHVEPFSDVENPEDLQPSIPNTSSPNIKQHRPTSIPTPVLEEQPFHQTEKQSIAGQTTSPSSPLFDDESWIQQAQEDQPQRISESSRNSLNSSAALAKEDFDRDLAAILGSDQRPQQTETSPQTESIQNTSPYQPFAEPDPNAPQTHPSHDIFDQMGLGMKYANSFDLGEVNLQERFDQYDQELEQTQVKEKTTSDAQSIQSPFVDPMELSDFDLVAELAEISEEYPHVAKAVCNPGRQTEQEQLTENNQVDEDNDRVGEHHE